MTLSECPPLDIVINAALSRWSTGKPVKGASGPTEIKVSIDGEEPVTVYTNIKRRKSQEGCLVTGSPLLGLRIIVFCACEVRPRRAYVALEEQNVFKEKLGAKIIVEKNKGHFSRRDNVKELPSALDSLLEIISKA